MIKKEKDAKEKKGGKTIFHYFEENAQYRIERPPVITGGLKRHPRQKTNGCPIMQLHFLPIRL